MKKVINIVLILICVGCLIGWTYVKREHIEVKLDVAEVGKQTLQDSVLASGNLIFNTQVNIRSELTGRVIDVPVLEGQYVKKGQVLLKLDPVSFEAVVRNQEAALNVQKMEIELVVKQRNELARQLGSHEKLLQKGLIKEDAVYSLRSQLSIKETELDTAKERLVQSKANLQQAKDQLNKTTIRAPMDGMLASVDIKVGETVIAGTTNIIGSDLMTLGDPSMILAELRVDEADIGNVKLGQQTLIYSASEPSQAIVGEISAIGTSARKLGEGNGLSFQVKVLLPNQKKRLFPGMSCRAEIVVTESNLQQTVPISAIHLSENGAYVWVLAHGKVTKRAVETGLSNDTHQVISKGLEAGETVVIGPSRLAAQLQDGQSATADGYQS